MNSKKTLFSCSKVYLSNAESSSKPYFSSFPLSEFRRCAFDSMYLFILCKLSCSWRYRLPKYLVYFQQCNSSKPLQALTLLEAYRNIISSRYWDGILQRVPPATQHMPSKASHGFSVILPLTAFSGAPAV
jgi:hypothetical protein